ncbi:MAG: glycoside hydrolase family 44 protein [Bryobacteraceae bacterium]
MKPILALALGLLAACAAAAQQAGPALSIDASAGQHAISPDIYGINFYWDLSTDTDPLHIAAAEIRATARRWGGNESDRYDYRTDYRNKTADWYFEDLQDAGTPGLQLPEGSSFNQYADQVRTTNGKILATANVLGWLPKAQPACSYSVAKYGQQCSTDTWWPSCGDGLHTGSGSSCGSAILTNDPTDANFQVDQTYQQGWISYLLSRYGQGNQGGAAIWDLANEPIWWDDTNQDIHPNPYTYDELLSLDMASAIAIKQADPTALVSGPVADNYASIWYSKKDIVSGQAKGAWWANPVDRNAHGGVPIMAWYLQQFQAYETKNNVRLLDYYDTHAYLAPGSDPASLLDSTREWWDPTYIVDGNYWICDPTNNGAPTAPQLIPRLKAIINANYPGTKLAITEYSFGSLDTITGALAQADILGIFGREGVDLATLWGPPKPTDPGAFAFRMYGNYDGIGGAFGESGVQATSADQSQLSVYGALRSDLNLTAIVINKTGNHLSSTLNLANFSTGPAAHVWQYSGANLGAIVAQPDVATNAGAVTTVFPANSITLLVIPPATLPVPQPVVRAVTNAASYGAAIAPGQMVDVWGTGMGPTTPAGLALDSNGMVGTSVAGVRILFDGIPAPLVYVSAKQCAAVVPYFGAYNPTTHVQVEYQGVRSAPLVVPVSATAPGLFTANASGTGQGSILNQDNTVNSVANPASRGSVVILWGTGEGLTDPPGVDGRLAVDVLPAPLAAVAVDIGGLPATVQYAGAAPGMMPGVMQINAQMSPNVQAGNAVPVAISIGGGTSQTGVTLAVQ